MLKENRDNLRSFYAEYSPDAEQKEKIIRYVELVEEWSEKTNLVSRSDVTKIVGKHIIESMLYNNKNILKEKCNIVDLGSGAGFPGIPLKIFNPASNFTLVDSRKIKALFLQEAVDVLQFSNAAVLCERIENTEIIDFNGQVDVVTARAVANLKKLWSWTRSLLIKNGILFVIKGGDFEIEIAEARKDFDDFDVEIKNTEYISESNNALSQILLIKK